ncbi:MAG: DUF202 domain-containing protein [Phycisphaerae bacterium]|nr:DUF202 domain-containing protein [Phycisphaerae bacterium]
MSKTPYSAFANGNLILRDLLAIDRTVLANERTYLAYVRTALALIITGASFIHFLNWIPGQLVGWAMVPMGVVILVIGTWRYRQVKIDIEQVRNLPPHPNYAATGQKTGDEADI